MKSQELGISVAIAVLLAAVFLIDVRTGLGFTPWLLYVIPLGLTYWIASVYSPLMVAAVCIALMFVGFALSPPLVPPPIALTNRLFGTVTFLAIAGLIVAYKLLARRLSLLTDQLRQELFERTQDLGRAVRVLRAEMAIKSRDVATDGSGAGPSSDQRSRRGKSAFAGTIWAVRGGEGAFSRTPAGGDAQRIGPI